MDLCADIMLGWIANNFTQTHGVDYLETSPIGCHNFIFAIFSTVANVQQPMFQLDAKNAILYWQF